MNTTRQALLLKHICDRHSVARIIGAEVVAELECFPVTACLFNIADRKKHHTWSGYAYLLNGVQTGIR